MSALSENEAIYYSPQAYLLLEEQATVKGEYYQGQIIAMSGASLTHNRLVSRLHVALANGLAGKPGEVFMSDLRVEINQGRNYFYPDVTVVCGEPQLAGQRNDTITNPTIVIEVLSTSTEQKDRGDKFRAYEQLASLTEYVLVDQYRVRVEYFRRVSPQEWQLLVLTDLAETVQLQSIAVTISLADIYRGITFEPPKSPTPFKRKSDSKRTKKNP